MWHYHWKRFTPPHHLTPHFNWCWVGIPLFYLQRGTPGKMQRDPQLELCLRQSGQPQSGQYQLALVGTSIAYVQGHIPCHASIDAADAVFFSKPHFALEQRILHTLDVSRTFLYYISRTKPFKLSPWLYPAIALVFLKVRPSGHRCDQNGLCSVSQGVTS